MQTRLRFAGFTFVLYFLSLRGHEKKGDVLGMNVCFNWIGKMTNNTTLRSALPLERAMHYN